MNPYAPPTTTDNTVSLAARLFDVFTLVFLVCYGFAQFVLAGIFVGFIVRVFLVILFGVCK